MNKWPTNMTSITQGTSMKDDSALDIMTDERKKYSKQKQQTADRTKMLIRDFQERKKPVSRNSKFAAAPTAPIHQNVYGMKGTYQAHYGT